MKALKAIEELQKLVEKHGPDLEIFVTAPGFNSSETFDVKYMDNCVRVENLDEYPKHLVFEEHGGNTGLVFGAVFCGKNSFGVEG
jgi:hypothetical protein